MTIVNQRGQKVREYLMDCVEDFEQQPEQLAAAVLALAEHLRLNLVLTNATDSCDYELIVRPKSAD